MRHKGKAGMFDYNITKNFPSEKYTVKKVTKQAMNWKICLH